MDTMTNLLTPAAHVRGGVISMQLELVWWCTTLEVLVVMTITNIW